MAGEEWSEIEICLAVHFASQGVYHRVIAEMFAARGFNRTKVSVDGKLRAIQIKHPNLGSQRHWNSHASGQWVRTRLRENNISENVLLLTSEDWRTLSQSQPDLCHLQPLERPSTFCDEA
ncbi:hypothetical protein ACJ73_03089 [Blastomyces percursus]|uniref:Uncharacterized protein n=1 Tax=Blastomyces percursus TaxID=1658174 RepID=A0A1J9QAQ9_9EURO|nr:hypothetical protein ACJ73_03089 [Blastomyces percursus]